jgi:hemerythrin-like domain-containing protein
MNPVETLQSEHRTIGVALDILEAICRRIERTRTVENPEHIDALVDFLMNFADKGHHGKEETLLYPLLEDTRTAAEGNWIWRMMREHELGREFLRGVRRAMERCRDNDPEGPEMLVYMALGYIEATRRHMRSETAILQDLDDKRLSVTDRERLASSFEAIEKNWFGPDQYAAYRAVPTRLGRFYIH